MATVKRPVSLLTRAPALIGQARGDGRLLPIAGELARWRAGLALAVLDQVAHQLVGEHAAAGLELAGRLIEHDPVLVLRPVPLGSDRGDGANGGPGSLEALCGQWSWLAVGEARELLASSDDRDTAGTGASGWHARIRGLARGLRAASSICHVARGCGPFWDGAGLDEIGTLIEELDARVLSWRGELTGASAVPLLEVIASGAHVENPRDVVISAVGVPLTDRMDVFRRISCLADLGYGEAALRASAGLARELYLQDLGDVLIGLSIKHLHHDIARVRVERDAKLPSEGVVIEHLGVRGARQFGRAA